MCISANISVHVNNLKNLNNFSIMAKHTEDESAFYYAQQRVVGLTKIF